MRSQTTTTILRHLRLRLPLPLPHRLPPASNFPPLALISLRAPPTTAHPRHFHPPTQRHYSTTPPPAPKPYTFPTLSHALTTTPTPTPPSPPILLIDVREPSEYAAGHIPSAVNMPILTHPDAPFLPPAEFLDKFGFQKPTEPTSGEDTHPAPQGREVVFYCKAGIRSAAAARMALEAGWKGVGEYRGSWMEWVKEGGPVEGGKGEGN